MSRRRADAAAAVLAFAFAGPWAAYLVRYGAVSWGEYRAAGDLWDLSPLMAAGLALFLAAVLGAFFLARAAFVPAPAAPAAEAPPPGRLRFGESVFVTFVRTFSFRGRAVRGEFLWWWLFVFVWLPLLLAAFHDLLPEGRAGAAFLIIALAPAAGLIARRLRDAGQPAAFALALLFLLPWPWVFYWCLCPSHEPPPPESFFLSKAPAALGPALAVLLATLIAAVPVLFVIALFLYGEALASMEGRIALAVPLLGYLGQLLFALQCLARALFVPKRA